MTPNELAEYVDDVLVSLIDDGTIAGVDQNDRPEVVIERPKNADHGDYATNVAMRLAKPARRSPRDLAALIGGRLVEKSGIAAVDVAGPGFLNITVSAQSQGQIAADVVVQAENFGQIETLRGQRINVEFISANPTGPLHLGHTRWAAVGDALAAVLAAAGADVDREFYINDRGAQLDLFGDSLMAVANGEPTPENGYHGSYIKTLASVIVAENPTILELPPDEQSIAFREQGYARQLAEQQEALRHFHTNFDTWFSERSLHEDGGVARALEALREQGHVYELDGAVWLRTTDFGDDKDRVLIKANGDLTYFASDCAYYIDKRRRGFDLCLYLLGADHHGYVNRLRSVAACAGDEPDDTMQVLIGQLVKIMRDGEEVRLSKRAGEIVTLTDLVDEVGVDAARYSLIRYPADSPLVLDLGLLVKRSNDNPVYYVQYAHARISSVLRNATGAGIDWRTGSIEFDPAKLAEPAEGTLLRTLADFPQVIETAAQLREPHRVARYLEDLATHYHKFYDTCRVLPRTDESVTATTVARLWLCAATRQTLFNGLALLGVSAPQRM